jgi:hypothetical protein
LKHYYEQIPGWFDFQDLYKRMVQEARPNATFVEVGTFLGRSLSYLGVEIVNSKKPIALISVDTLGIIASPGTPTNYDRYVGQDGHALLLSNMAPCVRAGLRHTHLHIDSVEASKLFHDVDFVFLDSDHSYEGVSRELDAWWPKVVNGGVLAGHDHIPQFPGVIQAVREFFGGKASLVSKSSFMMRKP